MTDLLECGRTGQRVPIPGIIDMHGHLGRFAYAVPKLEARSIVAVMDRIGVEAMVCSHVECCLGVDPVRGNDEVLAAARAFPGRVLGYVGVWPCGEGHVRAEVERCLHAGFVGVKVHCEQGFPYTYPAYTPAYQAAHERRLPVLLHTWGGAKEFTEIAELAGRYPEASFLLAHAGSRNEGEYLRMAREHPNVFLDTALSFSPRGCVARLVAGAGLEKVVWGSDVYCFSQTQQIGKVLGARISDEAKTQILAGNARRLLDRRRA
jgi:predicted TIM-barrel fold metal-dependent hydrolase